jgi:hypothetical protein
MRKLLVAWHLAHGTLAAMITSGCTSSTQPLRFFRIQLDLNQAAVFTE